MPLTLRLPALGATPRVDVPPAPYQLRQPPRMFQEEKGKPKPDPRVDVPPVTHQPHQPRRMFREKRETKTRPTGGCSTRYSPTSPISPDVPRKKENQNQTHGRMFHPLLHLSDVPRGRRKPPVDVPLTTYYLQPSLGCSERKKETTSGCSTHPLPPSTISRMFREEEGNHKENQVDEELDVPAFVHSTGNRACCAIPTNHALALRITK